MIKQELINHKKMAKKSDFSIAKLKALKLKKRLLTR
jgi:hypothetical protein